MQSETRRDAFYNVVATQIAVKVMEASKAAVKAETRRVDSYDDVVEMMEEFHAAAASQAAVEADVALFTRNEARKAFEAEAYDDVEDEARAAVASQVRRYIAALEMRGVYYDIY